MTERLQARAFPRVWSDDIAFFVFREEDGKRLLAHNLEFKEVGQGVYEPEPTFALTTSHAQRLMDELWSCGLRPTQGKQSEGVTAAQGRHLEDMRAMAFAKLNIEKPA